ncbi:unnamed protein product [Diamesa hyperborea]
MATKETMILFVYDIESCQNEHDDPLQSIKYFHPSWVSDIQKLSLCGQLMGLMNFCSEFFCPEIISLQNGKFVIKQFGRFVLAVGTDRNIHESLLNHRAELLVKILKLYHNDLNQLFELFKSSEPKQFSDKLYHIFETYLPILQYNGNLLQNVYKLFLPKSASNLYLDAIQILEHVTSKSGVLGGMILYHNKVVATQLSVDLTKILTTTDPVRIKTTGEIIAVDFHKPNGSQLMRVWVSVQDYNKLSQKKKRSIDSTALNAQNSMPLPFSIKKKPKEASSSSMLKRDKSLIFSLIPEEESLVEILSPIDAPPKRPVLIRPNHLPLKFKSIPLRGLPESGIGSINFDETDSFPDFIGKTSVCCTPMTENKVLAGPILSIFANQEEEELKPENGIKENAVDSNKSNGSAFQEVFINYTNNPFKACHRKNSWNELNKITDLDENDEAANGSKFYNPYNTIADPSNPLFNLRKQPMSKTLFEDYKNLFVTDENFFKPPEKEIEKLQEDLESKRLDPVIEDFIQKTRNETNFSPTHKIKSTKKKMLKLPLKSLSLDLDVNRPSTSAGINSIFDSPATKSKKYQGSLQLTPLLSKLTLLAMSENENYSSGFSSLDLPTPIYQDTPIDNPNRTFQSRLIKTKEDIVEVPENDVDCDEMKRVDLFVCGQQNMSLFVIMEEGTGDQPLIQSMVSLLKSSFNPSIDIILLQFDLCVNRLSRLELKLNETININVDNLDSTENDYSFINLDKKWDILKRGGVWQQNDLQTILLMHENFKINQNISDITVRTEDAVLYGHNNTGESEIFYYQHASQKQSSGLPAPSDFGVIQAAKRRLERDHAVVMF